MVALEPLWHWWLFSLLQVWGGVGPCGGVTWCGCPAFPGDAVGVSSFFLLRFFFSCFLHFHFGFSFLLSPFMQQFSCCLLNVLFSSSFTLSSHLTSCKKNHSSSFMVLLSRGGSWPLLLKFGVGPFRSGVGTRLGLALLFGVGLAFLVLFCCWPSSGPLFSWFLVFLFIFPFIVCSSFYFSFLHFCAMLHSSSFFVLLSRDGSFFLVLELALHPSFSGLGGRGVFLLF